MDDIPIPIASIRKNGREEFRVALREPRAGLRMIDLRVYAHNGVEAVPTSKGVMIRTDQLPEVIAALQEAQAKAGAGRVLADAPVPKPRSERD